MGSEELETALETVEVSAKFLLLFILGLFLSLHSILLQRRQLCLTLEGGDPEGLPSPFPFQHAAGAITLGGTGFFFQLTLRAYRTALDSGSRQAICLLRWNLLASALILIAAAVRLWALEAGQGQAAASLAGEESEALPA